MSYIDISLGLHTKLPHFPNTPGFTLEWFKRIERGHDCNNSRIESDVHFGTHIDAPLHFIQGGKTVDQLSPDILIGPAWVVDLQAVAAITSSHLTALFLKCLRQICLKGWCCQISQRNFKVRIHMN